MAALGPLLTKVELSAQCFWCRLERSCPDDVFGQPLDAEFQKFARTAMLQSGLVIGLRDEER
jgi:hypothetical protein